MKEKPILFSAPMVRALLDGSKTQTRRVLKATFDNGPWTIKPAQKPRFARHTHDWWLGDATTPNSAIKCPYGDIGDQLWVKETWRTLAEYNHLKPSQLPDDAMINCKAGFCGIENSNYNILANKYRSPLFMQKRFSRITLEITGVRVERLNDCTESDSIAEGIEPNWCGDLTKGYNGFGGEGWTPENGWNHYLHSVDGEEAYTPLESYQSLWESINGAGSWNTNPWVWVIEFKVVKP